MVRLLAGFSLLVLAPFALAGSQDEAKSRARAIAPYLGDQAVMVAYVNLDKVNVAEVVNSVAKTVGATEEELEVVQKSMAATLGALKEAGVKKIFAVSSLADFPIEPFFVVVPLEEGSREEKIANLFKTLIRAPGTRKIGNSLVAGREPILERLEKAQGQPDKMLIPALTATADTSVQVVFLLPETVRKALGEVVPRLPRELGGMSTEPVTRGFQWASLGFYPGPEMQVKAIVKTRNAESAKELKQLANELMDAGMEQAKKAGMAPLVEKFRKLLTPRIEKDRLVIQMKQKEMVAMLVPLVMKMRSEATRMQSSNNLKQIGLALHNYLATYRNFPPSVFRDKNGKPLLSWRVYLLPYLEQPKLFREFKLDEPWNSPHNKKLIARMPMVYRSPTSKAPPGMTTYLAPITKSSVLDPHEGVKINKIADGTSNTIMVLEANDNKAVIWTKPEDLPVDAKDPIKGLNQERGFLGLFADGSVRFISATIDRVMLNALFSKDGGEVIGNIP